MQGQIIIKGRLVGPRNVELDEPISTTNSEVDVIVRVGAPDAIADSESISDFLRHLPTGIISKDEIDQRLRSERSAWSD